MSNKQGKVSVRRTGYEGSGFAFYFVRCPSKQAFQKYLATARISAPAGTKLSELDAISFCQREEVLRGLVEFSAPVSPSAKADFIVESYMVVVADADAKEERRRWYHEIGHVTDWCAQHLAIIRRDHLVRPEGNTTDEESRALLNEFLLTSLDAVLAGEEAHGTSGLPTAMPWISASEVKGEVQ